MLGYRVPAPDQVKLISGGKYRGDTPFRVVTGHGRAFIVPFFLVGQGVGIYESLRKTTSATGRFGPESAVEAGVGSEAGARAAEFGAVAG
jgi:hypothetical protein